MKQKLQTVLAILMSYISEPLPQSAEALEKFIKDTLAIGNLTPHDGNRLDLVKQLLQLDHNKSRVTKQSCIKAIRRGIANGYAFNEIERIKERYKNDKAIEGSAGQVVQQT